MLQKNIYSKVSINYFKSAGDNTGTYKNSIIQLQADLLTYSSLFYVSLLNIIPKCDNISEILGEVILSTKEDIVRFKYDTKYTQGYECLIKTDNIFPDDVNFKYYDSVPTFVGLGKKIDIRRDKSEELDFYELYNLLFVESYYMLLKRVHRESVEKSTIRILKRSEISGFVSELDGHNFNIKVTVPYYAPIYNLHDKYLEISFDCHIVYTPIPNLDGNNCFHCIPYLNVGKSINVKLVNSYKFPVYTTE
jgi:hypothetical protein